MTTIATARSSQSKRKRTKPSPSQVKSNRSPDQKTAAQDPDSVPNLQPRITKQELVLTLLSRSDGATIPEIMQATNWLEKSVRGFFAGTVKKKLGFHLTSTKVDGKPRIYRIVKKRGR